jgi:paraquat-inducible protein B
MIMTTKVNYYKLGIFVLGSTILAIILLVALGAGQLFQRKIMLETYFNESVQGLSIGSKVKYRGVVIGEVSRITFTFAKYEKNLPPAQRKRYVLVEAAMQQDLLTHDTRFGTDDRAFKEEVAKGLRIRLAFQGLTGASYLEIDYIDPVLNTPLPITWQPTYSYIPSTPSTTAQFMKSFELVFDRLQALDIEDTIANWNRLIVATTKRVEAVDTAQISSRINRVLSRLDQVPLEALGKDAAILVAQLKEVSSGLKALINDPAATEPPGDINIIVKKVRNTLESPAFNHALHNLERSLQRIDRITAGSELDIRATLENLQHITANLRDLTETAKHYPASVLFGEPPPKLEGSSQ